MAEFSLDIDGIKEDVETSLNDEKEKLENNKERVYVVNSLGIFQNKISNKAIYFVYSY